MDAQAVIRQHVELALQTAGEFHRKNHSLYPLLERGDFESDAYIALCELVHDWTQETTFDAFLVTELPKRLRSVANRMAQLRRVAKRDNTASIDDAFYFTHEPSEAFIADICQLLSKDEGEIVRLMAKGTTKNTKIAQSIDCGRETVARRLESIRGKLREWHPNNRGSRGNSRDSKIFGGHHRTGEQRVRLGEQWQRLRAKKEKAC